MLKKTTLPDFYVLGYEMITKNDALQQEVAEKTGVLMQHLPALLAQMPANARLVQYYTAFDKSSVVDESNYMKQGLYNMGMGIQANQPLALQNGQVQRKIEAGNYLHAQMQTTMQDMGKDTHAFWDKYIWTNEVFAQRSFLFDFVEYQTQNNQDFTVSFYIGIH
jgi:hypothetical protein